MTVNIHNTLAKMKITYAKETQTIKIFKLENLNPLSLDFNANRLCLIVLLIFCGIQTTILFTLNSDQIGRLIEKYTFYPNSNPDPGSPGST